MENTLTPLTILTNARALIANPENWTTDFYARDASGNEVDANSNAAVCFCALGAITRVIPEDCYSCETVRLLELAAGNSWVQFVNDRDGHAAVLAMYDRAIARLTTEGVK